MEMELELELEMELDSDSLSGVWSLESGSATCTQCYNLNMFSGH